MCLLDIIIYVGVVDRAGGLECGTPEEFCVIVKVTTVSLGIHDY